MDFYHDYLGAIEIATLQLKAGPLDSSVKILENLLDSLVPRAGVEYAELHAIVLYLLGHAEERLGQSERAGKRREEAAALLDGLEAPGSVLGIEDCLANTLIQVREFRRAIPHCDRAVKLIGKDAAAVALRLLRAGVCYLNAGYREQAEAPLRQALEIFRDLDSSQHIPAVLGELGRALVHKNPQEAEACFQEAASRWEQAGKSSQASNAWLNLGFLCAANGRLPDALVWYDKVRKVREGDPSTPPARLGFLYNNLANVYRRMGDFAPALELVQSAIALLEPSRDRSLAQAYGSYGLILRDQGADEQALVWFHKARLEHEKQPSPDCLQLAEKLENEAAALRRLGRAEEAQPLERRLAQLRSDAPPKPTYDLGPLKKAVSSTDGAVIVELDGASLPDAVCKEYDLATLENRIEAVLASEAVGDYDGHEFGPRSVRVFLYGPDGEALYRAIEPTLLQYPLCRGARVTIRQGDHERQIAISPSADGPVN